MLEIVIMPVYGVTFRMAKHTINGVPSAKRRRAFITRVRPKHRGLWEETASFILVDSELDIDTFNKLATADLSEQHDFVLIFDTSDMAARSFGAVATRQTLYGLLLKARDKATGDRGISDDQYSCQNYYVRAA